MTSCEVRVINDNPVVKVTENSVNVTINNPRINVVLSNIGPAGAMGPGIIVKMGNFNWASPADTTITLIAYSVYAFDINELFALALDAGEITTSIQINGTPVEGLDDITVNATPQNIAAGSSKRVQIGDELTVVLTDNESAQNLRFTMQGTLVTN